MCVQRSVCSPGSCAYRLLCSAPLPCGLRSGRASRSCRSPRWRRRPTIDGAIAEDEWPAPVLDQHLIQFDPEKGKPSPLRTAIRVGTDREGPLRGVYRLHGRRVPDRGSGDDSRRRSGRMTIQWLSCSTPFSMDARPTYFRPILSATQLDGRIAENGRTVDLTWDAAWRSAAQRLGERYISRDRGPL